MNIRKILVPIIFLDVSRRAVKQAAYLARHFHSEITLLHVVTPLDYPAGMLELGHEITARDLHAEIVRAAQKNLDQAFLPELEGLSVKRTLLRGHPAREIVETARNENTDLIVISTHGHGPVYRSLLGSVAAKVLHDSDRPIWTGAHLEEATGGEFAVRNVLCGVDLTRHSHHTLSRAAKLAAVFGARLTVAHVTAGVEMYGPGGSYVNKEWKEILVRGASEEMTKLQQDVGINAEFIIENGSVPKLMKEIAKHTKADVLVIGRSPLHSHLGADGNGYSVIREAGIPVLSI